MAMDQNTFSRVVALEVELKQVRGEIERLHKELAEAKEQLRTLQAKQPAGRS